MPAVGRPWPSAHDDDGGGGVGKYDENIYADLVDDDIGDDDDGGYW